MSAADRPGYYPPELYDHRWLWLGVGLLVLVAAWYVFVWWYSSPAKVRRVALTGDRLARLKDRYLDQIGQVVARVEEGGTDLRTGHQQLSALVRHFVQEASGRRSSAMTLTDLNRSPDGDLRPVAHVVGQLYPGEFGPAPRTVEALRTAADAAGQVVRAWT